MTKKKCHMVEEIASRIYYLENCKELKLKKKVPDIEELLHLEIALDELFRLLGVKVH